MADSGRGVAHGPANTGNIEELLTLSIEKREAMTARKNKSRPRQKLRVQTLRLDKTRQVEHSLIILRTSHTHTHTHALTQTHTQIHVQGWCLKKRKKCANSSRTLNPIAAHTPHIDTHTNTRTPIPVVTHAQAAPSSVQHTKKKPQR